MKKFLKIFGGIIIAAALTAAGYAAGSHNGITSISSALPRVSLNHAKPSSAPDEPKDIEPEDKNKDIEKALDEKEEMDKAAEPAPTGRTVVKTNESASSEGWTLVKSYEGELIDGDKSNVSVYTSAQTEDGEIIWDDGQQWAVEVRDGSGGYYVLMDRYINNGSVYFEVLDIDGAKVINIYTKTTAGTDIKQYTYSGGGFTETTLYSSGAANTLYSTVPDYQ